MVLYKPINKRQYNNMIDKHIINYPNIEKDIQNITKVWM